MCNLQVLGLPLHTWVAWHGSSGALAFAVLVLVHLIRKFPGCCFQLLPWQPLYTRTHCFDQFNCGSRIHTLDTSLGIKVSVFVE